MIALGHRYYHLHAACYCATGTSFLSSKVNYILSPPQPTDAYEDVMRHLTKDLTEDGVVVLTNSSEFKVRWRTR